MKDYLGHDAAPQPAGFRPRGGQFVLFRLKDLGAMGRLAQDGAHCARDGSLVAIFQQASLSPEMTVTKADGTVAKEGGEYIPAHFVLMDENGNNFCAPYKDKKTGHGVFTNILFWADSPNLADVRPLEDMADFPPGRAHHPAWKPCA